MPFAFPEYVPQLLEDISPVGFGNGASGSKSAVHCASIPDLGSENALFIGRGIFKPEKIRLIAIHSHPGLIQKPFERGKGRDFLEIFSRSVIPSNSENVIISPDLGFRSADVLHQNERN